MFRIGEFSHLVRVSPRMLRYYDKCGLLRPAEIDRYSGLSTIGQRLWFYGKTRTYKKKPDINAEKCIGCGLCVKLCPMKNLSIKNNKAVSTDRCTLCYRCFSHCPTQALTILGKKVYEQCLAEKYLP